MAVSPYLVTEIGIEEVFPLLCRDRLTLKLLKISSQPLLHRFCVIRKRTYSEDFDSAVAKSPTVCDEPVGCWGVT